MQYKLKMTREQVVERVREMVAYARSLCEDVEFSPEDAGRSDPEFLYQVLAWRSRPGPPRSTSRIRSATPLPEEFGALIAGIIANTPGIEKCIVSVHCHNDLGLATANTLAGLQAGARQAEVTINGIGERAGNTALEEVVMALQTRHPIYQPGHRHRHHPDHAHQQAGQQLHRHRRPAQQGHRRRECLRPRGRHPPGLACSRTSRPTRSCAPRSVGATQTKLVLGKHSGRHALKTRLTSLGYALDEAELDKVFERFKALADHKKIITDADLEALISDELYQPRELYTLDGLQVACGTMGMPTATVRLRDPEGRLHVQAAVGTGPVDAAYKAIDAIVQAPSDPAGIRRPCRHRRHRRAGRGDRAHPGPERLSTASTPKKRSTSRAPLAVTAPIRISSSPAPRPTWLR